MKRSAPQGGNAPKRQKFQSMPEVVRHIRTYEGIDAKTKPTWTQANNIVVLVFAGVYCGHTNGCECRYVVDERMRIRKKCDCNYINHYIETSPDKRLVDFFLGLDINDLPEAIAVLLSKYCDNKLFASANGFFSWSPSGQLFHETDSSILNTIAVHPFTELDKMVKRNVFAGNKRVSTLTGRFKQCNIAVRRAGSRQIIRTYIDPLLGEWNTFTRACSRSIPIMNKKIWNIDDGTVTERTPMNSPFTSSIACTGPPDSVEKAEEYFMALAGNDVKRYEQIRSVLGALIRNDKSSQRLFVFSGECAKTDFITLISNALGRRFLTQVPPSSIFNRVRKIDHVSKFRQMVLLCDMVPEKAVIQDCTFHSLIGHNAHVCFVCDQVPFCAKTGDAARFVDIQLSEVDDAECVEFLQTPEGVSQLIGWMSTGGEIDLTVPATPLDEWIDAHLEETGDSADVIEKKTMSSNYKTWMATNHPQIKPHKIKNILRVLGATIDRSGGRRLIRGFKLK
jgi:hypothetical protein